MVGAPARGVKKGRYGELGRKVKGRGVWGRQRYRVHRVGMQVTARPEQDTQGGVGR